MDDAIQPILKYPLSKLNNIGLYAKKKSKYDIILSTFYFATVLFILALTLANFFHIKGSIIIFVSNLEGLTAWFQVIVKLLTVIYHQTSFVDLMESTKSFWDTKKCTREVKEKLDKLFVNVLVMLKVSFGIILITGVVLSMSPFFGTSLPVGYWSLDGYDLLYKFQKYAMMIAMPVTSIFLIGFDGCFLTMCIMLTMQFRIICNCMENIQISNMCLIDSTNKTPSNNVQENVYQQLTVFSQYHLFLLRTTKKLQDLYSTAIICEYLASSPTICAEIYAIFQSKDYGTIIRNGLACTCIVVQLAFYCISAEFVSNEAEKVSFAIYNSDWYLQHFSIVKCPLLLIMQKSQQKIVFTAGGLLEINCKSLLTALKVAWSAFTLMRALDRKQNLQ